MSFAAIDLRLDDEVVPIWDDLHQRSPGRRHPTVGEYVQTHYRAGHRGADFQVANDVLICRQPLLLFAQGVLGVLQRPCYFLLEGALSLQYLQTGLTDLLA